MKIKKTLLLVFVIAVWTHMGCYSYAELEKMRKDKLEQNTRYKNIDSAYIDITMDSLYIGIPYDAIEDQFGEPDCQFITEIGREVKHKRCAHVVQYFVDENPFYEFLSVPYKTTFVFENDTLIYWDIQQKDN